MEQALASLINAAAGALDAYSALIAAHPWVLWATAALPALPAFFALAIPSAVLCGALGVAASVVFVLHPLVGCVAWGGAWGLSMALAGAKREKRARARMMSGVTGA